MKKVILSRLLSMATVKKLLIAAFVAIWMMWATPSKAQATTLTGLIEFSTNESGSANGAQIWNTRGGKGDDFYDLWVQQNGKFINGGDDSHVAIDLSLDTPGVYTFKLYGEPSFESGYFALNLFFNGNNSKPGISVFAPINHQGFCPNSNTNTLPLAALAASAVPGAGTLTFVDGSTTVTLTSYSWFSSNVENVDLVSPYSVYPSGRNDFTGQFTLVVKST